MDGEAASSAAATVSPCKLSGNLDTGAPNRVHQSFTAREDINYKQIRPLVLVEQHGDQRDTMEMRLLLQPCSPSSGRWPGSRWPLFRLSHDTPLLLFYVINTGLKSPTATSTTSYFVHS